MFPCRDFSREFDSGMVATGGRGEGGVLFGISGGGVPPASPNPDPISEQRMPFQTWPQKSIPVFGPTFDRLMFVVFVQTGNAFFVD